MTGGADLDVVAGSHVLVITAGAKQQQPDQSRMELAGTNVGILERLLPQLFEPPPMRSGGAPSNRVDDIDRVAA